MRRILVISNMYPSKEWPHYGVFVKNCVELLRNDGYKVDVVYIKKTTSKIKKNIFLCNILFNVNYKRNIWTI